MTEQAGTGKTAGLPGEHADPQTAEVTDDERDETVAMGDVAPPALEDKLRRLTREDDSGGGPRRRTLVTCALQSSARVLVQ